MLNTLLDTAIAYSKIQSIGKFRSEAYHDVSCILEYNHFSKIIVRVYG